MRFIAVFLLQGGRREGGGYKGVEEGSGPGERDCPPYFFNLVPEPDGENGAAWREEVRAYHAKQRAGDFPLARPAGRTSKSRDASSVPREVLLIESLKRCRLIVIHITAGIIATSSRPSVTAVTRSNVLAEQQWHGREVDRIDSNRWLRISSHPEPFLASGTLGYILF